MLQFQCSQVGSCIFRNVLKLVQTQQEEPFFSVSSLTNGQQATRYSSKYMKSIHYMTFCQRPICMEIKCHLLTFDTLTADVEAVLTADFKNDTLLGLAVQAGVLAVAILVGW